eukprot:TRINITY_DN16865_c0_g1_i1.p1 TRINITY_DN16865_c0_g1~~TRINITY_DN16865_c0_g1_i1.p1  ORF type:complete len:132 (+),score=3.86 TRINITY_DN16865_c0_g1_i1:215-610(+)
MCGSFWPRIKRGTTIRHCVLRHGTAVCHFVVLFFLGQRCVLPRNWAPRTYECVTGVSEREEANDRLSVNIIRGDIGKESQKRISRPPEWKADEGLQGHTNSSVNVQEGRRRVCPVQCPVNSIIRALPVRKG